MHDDSAVAIAVGVDVVYDDDNDDGNNNGEEKMTTLITIPMPTFALTSKILMNIVEINVHMFTHNIIPTYTNILTIIKSTSMEMPKALTANPANTK